MSNECFRRSIPEEIPERMLNGFHGNALKQSAEAPRVYRDLPLVSISFTLFSRQRLRIEGSGQWSVMKV